MTGDVKKFTFKIADFTPETMPFGRLVKYYAEIARMIGTADNLHLLDIVESSHGSAFAIDRNHEAELIKRLDSIKKGTAPKQAIRAHGTINAMLKEDNTSGMFSDPDGKNVIVFPGKRTDESSQIRIRDAATFTGELYHIAGTRDDAKIRINTDAYGVVFCTTTKNIAKELRDYLFEDVKVSGRGVWTRGEGGAWDIDDFYITHFEPVMKENLRSAVNRLRSMGVNWPEDPLEKIQNLEEKDGSVH